MTGRQVILDGRVFGSELIRGNLRYFFGTVDCTREILNEIYPQFEFRFLKQVHGDHVTESKPGVEIADGHWTRQNGVALVIQTADCLPVLFGAEDFVLAAHAGWRGVEKEILLRAARILKEVAPRLDRILIGPHIQASSFEVGHDVAEQLSRRYLEVSPGGPSPLIKHDDPQKSYVNLSQIAAAQIRSVLGPEVPLEISGECTFSSPLFHSFRREKSQGRQYSFVVRESAP